MNAGRVRKLLTPALAILAAAGWYGTYATYGNGYDQGFAEGSRGGHRQSYDKGFTAGKDEAQRMARMEADAALTIAENEMRRQYQDQARAQLQQAYDAGMAAEAKAVIDHDIRFVAGKGNAK